MNSLSDIVAKLEAANAAFESAKRNEAHAIAERKKASLEQREAQAEFNDAVSALKKKRKSPEAKVNKPKAEKKPAAPKKTA